MNLSVPLKKEWVVTAMLMMVFVAAISPSIPGMGYDMDCWKQWAAHLNAAGLGNAYDLPGNNYPPFYQYILRLHGFLNGDTESIFRNIGYLRIYTLIFEFWGLWTVYKWLDRKPDFGFLLICSMLNIAYSYNMIFWGQVDGIMASLVFASFYQLSKSHLALSAALLVLAINMKLQSVIYFPLWGLLLLAALHRERKWNQLLLILPAMIGVQLLLLLPFAFGPGGIRRVWQVILDLTDWFPFLSMNAFNMWYWIVEDAGPTSPDTVKMLGMTAKQLGLLCFCAASFFAMLPVFRDTIATFFRKRSTESPKERIWLSAALVTLSFFYFNTQMHERYVHGTFIFLTAYAFERRKFGLYTLFSIAYLLNLEVLLRAFRLSNYGTLIFEPKFISLLFAGCIVWGFLLLYRAPWMKVERPLRELA